MSERRNTGIKEHLRKKLLERDNFQCQCCGITNAEHKRRFKHCLEMAHIVAVSCNGSNDAENIVTLCKYCHIFFDKGWLWATDWDELNRTYYKGKLQEISVRMKTLLKKHKGYDLKTLEERNKELLEFFLDNRFHVAKLRIEDKYEYWSSDRLRYITEKGVYEPANTHWNEITAKDLEYAKKHGKEFLVQELFEWVLQFETIEQYYTVLKRAYREHDIILESDKGGD